MNLEKHARQVIERMMTRGRLEDFFAARDYYGWERIKKEAMKIRSLDIKTLTFLSGGLNLILRFCYGIFFRP
ncbi:MAG: hypothetical protein AAGN35_22055 [Bacteroidota bacterium]